MNKTFINIKEMEERANYYSKLVDNHKIMKEFNSKPLFFRYNLRKKNVEYDLKCNLCKSTNVYMSDIFELLRCNGCNKETIPKVLEMK